MCFTRIQILVYFIELIVLNNFQTDRGTILNLLRTVSNRLRCTFPGCTNTDGLHDIPYPLRFRALKNKLYIPKCTRVCSRHMFENTWNTVQGHGRRSMFTANQINEMIELFCNSISTNTSDLPGEFSMRFNNIRIS